VRTARRVLSQRDQTNLWTTADDTHRGTASAPAFREFKSRGSLCASTGLLRRAAKQAERRKERKKREGKEKEKGRSVHSSDDVFEGSSVEERDVFFPFVLAST
jgi:hypothetical protein